MKSDRQLRQEIAKNRKLLRERKRETLGLPSSKPHTFTRDGHEYLHGMVEKIKRRMEIFRNAGGEVTWFDESDPFTIEEIRPANCQGCAETHLVGWNEGEWSHPKSKGERRCDCAEHSLWVCKPFHEAFHNRFLKSDRQRESGASQQKEAV